MLNKIDWEKLHGLLPTIVQSTTDGTVLMLGYMNPEALEKTLREGVVTFYSRSKQRLWTKGETSGNLLEVNSWALDCDHDALLVNVTPKGPTCHLGSESCFGTPRTFLRQLEQIIDARIRGNDSSSYVQKLHEKGTCAVGRKVCEEALEVTIASLQGNRQAIMEESADLLFHLLVNLRHHGLDLAEIINILYTRNTSRKQGC